MFCCLTQILANKKKIIQVIAKSAVNKIIIAF